MTTIHRSIENDKTMVKRRNKQIQITNTEHRKLKKEKHEAKSIPGSELGSPTTVSSSCCTSAGVV